MTRRDPNLSTSMSVRIRMRRQLIGMSQEKLGELLGITFQQVQKYEKGSNRISASRLFYAAKILGVPVQAFFEDLPGTEADAASANPAREERDVLHDECRGREAGQGLPRCGQFTKRKLDLGHRPGDRREGLVRVASCPALDRLASLPKSALENEELRGLAGHEGAGAGQMSRKNYVFTSESVSEGHPDKVCDRDLR